MPLIERVLFLAGDAGPDVVRRLVEERFTRLVVGGRPMLPTVERLMQTALQLGMDAFLLTDLSRGEGDPDGGLLRAVLSLRKADAALTNCGQVATILDVHHLRTALLLVGDEVRELIAFSSVTIADLDLLLSRCAQPFERG